MEHYAIQVRSPVSSHHWHESQAEGNTEGSDGVSINAAFLKIDEMVDSKRIERTAADCLRKSGKWWFNPHVEKRIRLGDCPSTDLIQTNYSSQAPLLAIDPLMSVQPIIIHRSIGGKRKGKRGEKRRCMNASAFNHQSRVPGRMVPVV